jgi:hypothetical protein
MGLRFRRSWSVIPGVRFNLGLKSGSVSLGMRGIHYTVGTSGSRVTVGIPGSGLFWTKKLNSRSAPGQRIQTQSSQARIGGAAHTQPPPTMPVAAKIQTISPRAVWGAQTQAALPATAGVNFQLGQRQTLSSAAGGTIAQRVLPPQNPGQSIITGQSPPVKYAHFFLPMWLIWSVVAVVVIAALCVTAAVFGDLVR